jgi:NADP-dependent 3-hydroxy acid dehydrogenase YdfG
MARPPLPLHGRVVAITGAGRGIGLATASALIGRGMRVAIGEIDVAAAEQAAARLGNNAIALPVDVANRASFAQFLDETERALGPIDVLINNAGIMPLGRVVDESDEIAERMLDVNVRGVLHGVKEILPRFIERRSGHLVNIASTAGKGGFAGGATYCGTKHFVVGFSEAVRAELRGTGVEVSCVMPGVVNTELSSGLSPARGVRNAEPDEVAQAIVEALEHPRFDVFVPRAIGRIGPIMGLLPRRAREGVTRAMKADRLLDQVDAGARQAYELRVAHAPHALPAPASKALPAPESEPAESGR